MAMPGAIDLAALAAAREAQAKAEERKAAIADGTLVALVIDVTEATFQAEVIEQSTTVPVIIDLWATWCEPCKQLSPILEKLTDEYAGRFILAKVDVDANPRVSQAFQVQSIPSVVAVINGQPVPLFQGALPEAQIRQYLDELLKVAGENGVTGVAGAAPADAPADEQAADPRFDAAFDAVEAGDWATAEAAYRTILDQTPADAEAQAGLGQVMLLRRTEGVDPAQALAAAADEPESLTAQSLAADIELISGRVEEAFQRMVGLVRSSSGEDRTAARDHLVGLFHLVGDADPRVGKARMALANALY
jgi:putative thioredoxin